MEQMKYDIEVTRMFPIDNGGAVKASCSVRIRGLMDINAVKVIDGRAGLWVAMPSIPSPEGKQRSLVWIIDLGLKNAIEDAVLANWRGGSRSIPRGRDYGADQEAPF
jgi:stage V sporulation protein G